MIPLKIVKRTTKVNLLCIVSIVLLLIAILPLFLIGFYSQPCADDFTYGFYTYQALQNGESWPSILKWTIYQVHSSYDTWQGTFSSIFFMALTPAVFGAKYYFFTTIIMLGILLFSHYMLLHKLLVNIFKVDFSSFLFIFSCFSFLLIESLHSPVNAIYWYNGAVHYTFMHGCMILLLTAAISIYTTKKWQVRLVLCICTSLLSIICGGSNYVTALLGIVCITGLFILGIHKRLSFWWQSAPLALYVLSFFVNITAPGNSMRQQSFTKQTPLTAIISSFKSAFDLALSWTNLPTLIMIIILIPVIWNMASKISFSFSKPLLVLLASICLYACMFTPNYYATSNLGPDRVLNITKMWFQLMILIDEIYIIGWLRNRVLISKREIPHYSLFYLAILGLLLVSLKILPNVLHDYSSYAAYVSLRTGEAQQFYAENMERLDKLTGDESVIILDELAVKPYLLYFDDITPDRYNWKNQAMARWYNKDYVILQQQE